jgi:hypothetical protein
MSTDNDNTKNTSASASALALPSLLTTVNNTGGGTTTEASSSTATTAAPTAWLDVCILSAYDLPQRIPPIGVQIDIIKDATTKDSSDANAVPPVLPSHTSGPPIQRHKDRNSFRFDSHNGTVRVKAQTLAELYSSSVVLTLLYPPTTTTASTTTTRLQATFPLHQLRIDHTKWLVLNLQAVNSVNTTSKEEQEKNDTQEENQLVHPDQQSTASSATSAFTVVSS